MAGEATSAAIQFVIQSVVDQLTTIFTKIRGLPGDAEQLRCNFSMIQGFLDDAQRKFITEEGVKAWLRQLEDVAFDADNVLDELKYQQISKKMKTKEGKAASWLPSFNQYPSHLQMAGQIKEINTKLESLLNTANGLRLQKILAKAPAADSAAASESTDSFTVDPIFIGRDKDVSKIVEMLTAPTQQPLSILPIVGMGGLGKTTLARKVFNHQTTKAHFGHHTWVHVSQHFDAEVLLRKILTDLRGGNVENESREGLLKKIKEALGAKTYLLVLDDVWNEERHKWDDFINSWRGITCTNGNAILITTRKAEVREIVKTQAISDLSGLSEDECWSIIKARAFMGGVIPPGFEDIGKSIAKRCRGLPLAANVIGGVLRGKSSRDEWLSIKDTWVSPYENNITKILKLSFDHLSSPSLKKCFAYCSVFPKGAMINRLKLIELWMAEGFLQPSQTRDMESVGNKNINLLLRNSLLQVLEKDYYNNVEYCGMHDLVHDLATSVIGLNDNSSDGARYVHWQGESSHPLKEQAKYLVRTLFYRSRGDISDINLSYFKSLHALTLMGYQIKELPDSIREMIHLRYLNIEETRIEYLPDSIGELYHLQTLRSATYSLKKLPITIKYLFNLRHLYLSRDTELPPQLGMLTSLRTLRYFKVGDEDGHRIVELGGLKNLKGELEIWNLEKVQGEEECKKACLFEKAGIEKLVLKWSGKREDCDINDENVLKGLKPHRDLKVLKIEGYAGACLPEWSLEMEGYDNLMEITLKGCKECTEIPRLGHLPCLKFVYLEKLEKVKSIGRSFYGIDDDGGCKDVVFPSLERLELGGVEGVERVGRSGNSKCEGFSLP